MQCFSETTTQGIQLFVSLLLFGFICDFGVVIVRFIRDIFSQPRILDYHVFYVDGATHISHTEVSKILLFC